MDLIVKLIGPGLCFKKLKDARRVLLLESVKVDATILQVQISQPQLEDDFLSQLTIDWNPVCTGLFDDLSLLEFFNSKASLVCVSEDVLLAKPL